MKRSEIEIDGMYKSGCKVVTIVDINGDMVTFLVVENNRNKPSVGTYRRIQWVSFQTNYHRIDWNISDFIRRTDAV